MPRARSTVWWLLVLTPACIYLGLVANYANNLPLVDDYAALLKTFLPDQAGDTPLVERLWAQHNEHRIVLPKLFAWLQWMVTGRMDFSTLVLLGACGWLAVVGLVAWMLRRILGLSRWEILAPVYLLLTPVHEESMLWAMAGLQNYWILVWGFLCLGCLAGRKAGWAVGFLVLAVLTSGNGLVLIPAGLSGLWLRREWRAGAFFGAAGGLLLALYFWNFHRVPYHPDPLKSLAHPGELAAYFCTFLGAVTGEKTTALGLGAVLVILLLWLMVRQRNNPIVVPVGLFLLGTAGMVAMSRSGLGSEQALSSRYRMYPLLLIALTGGMVTALMPGCVRRFWAVPTFVAAGWFFIVSFGNGPLGRLALMQVAIRTEFNLVAGRYPSHAHVTPILEQAKQAGLYDGWSAWRRLRPAPAQAWPQSRSLPPYEAERIAAHVDFYDGRYIQGWALLHGLDSAHSHLELILQGAESVWRVPVQIYERAEINTILRDGGDYRHAGFRLYLPAIFLPKGKYTIGIRVRQGAVDHAIWSACSYVPEDWPVEPQAGANQSQ